MNIERKNFSDAYNEYLENKALRCKKQGFDTYKRNFNNHILPYFKDIYLCDLKKKDIINWQNKLLQKDFGNSFYNSLYYNFSTFLDFCVDYEYIEKNIIKDIKKIKTTKPKKEHNIYSKREFRKFRRHLDNKIDKYFFTFMFRYGTRPSETIALRFSDLNNYNIKIQHSINRRGKRELTTPKNTYSIRTLQISILMKHRINKLKKYYIKKYNCFNIDFYIFGGKKPLATSTIDRHKKIAIEKAKLPYITQHEFRHSYATIQVNKMPVECVAKNIGHSKPSMTMDVYCHNEKRVHRTHFPKLFD